MLRKINTIYPNTENSDIKMGTAISEGGEVSTEDVTKDKLEKDGSEDAPPVSRENLVSIFL